MYFVLANSFVSPEPGLVIWVAIAFVIFVVLLRMFAWGPLLGALEEREASIQESLDAAATAMKRAEEISKKNDEALKEAEAVAQRIRKEAMEDAERIRVDRVEKARIEAEKMTEQARESIEREKRQAMLELHDHVAELAMKATEKILRAELDAKKNKKLVDDFIKDLSKN